MWKPASPIVITGQALTEQEAWWHEFGDELRRQCNDEVDGDWLIKTSNVLIRRSPDEDPRRMARLTYAILMFDPEEIEEAEDAARAQAMHSTPPHKPKRDH